MVREKGTCVLNSKIFDNLPLRDDTFRRSYWPSEVRLQSFKFAHHHAQSPHFLWGSSYVWLVDILLFSRETYTEEQTYQQ